MIGGWRGGIEVEKFELLLFPILSPFHFVLSVFPFKIRKCFWKILIMKLKTTPGYDELNGLLFEGTNSVEKNLRY